MLERLSERALTKAGAEFEAVLRASPEIDRGCSSLPWQLSAFACLSREIIEPCFWRDGDRFLLAGFHRAKRRLIACEQFWQFPSMLVGVDPVANAALLEAVAAEMGAKDAELTGLLRGGAQWMALQDRFGKLKETRQITLRVTSIEGGREGYLARQSAHFRARMRRVMRKASEAGIETELYAPQTLSETCGLFGRMLMLEKDCWKAAAGESIYLEIGDFYLSLCLRLAKLGWLRMLFLKQGQKDVAYLFGFSFDGCFRGLQMSYHQDFEQLDLGNLAQLEIIEAVKDEATLYDLGMDIDYKTRWAKESVERVTALCKF